MFCLSVREELLWQGTVTLGDKRTKDRQSREALKCDCLSGLVTGPATRYSLLLPLSQASLNMASKIKYQQSRLVEVVL